MNPNKYTTDDRRTVLHKVKNFDADGSVLKKAVQHELLQLERDVGAPLTNLPRNISRGTAVSASTLEILRRDLKSDFGLHGKFTIHSDLSVFLDKFCALVSEHNLPAHQSFDLLTSFLDPQFYQLFSTSVQCIGFEKSLKDLLVSKCVPREEALFKNLSQFTLSGGASLPKQLFQLKLHLLSLFPTYDEHQIVQLMLYKITENLNYEQRQKMRSFQSAAHARGADLELSDLIVKLQHMHLPVRNSRNVYRIEKDVSEKPKTKARMIKNITQMTSSNKSPENHSEFDQPSALEEPSYLREYMGSNGGPWGNRPWEYGKGNKWVNESEKYEQRPWNPRWPWNRSNNPYPNWRYSPPRGSFRPWNHSQVIPNRSIIQNFEETSPSPKKSGPIIPYNGSIQWVDKYYIPPQKLEHFRLSPNDDDRVKRGKIQSYFLDHCSLCASPDHSSSETEKCVYNNVINSKYLCRRCSNAFHLSIG